MITNAELELFAIKTGELYEKHKALARESASEPHGFNEAWGTHVFVTVLPLYRKETNPGFHEPCEKTAVKQAAIDLRDYYERHIKEI